MDILKFKRDQYDANNNNQSDNRSIPILQGAERLYLVSQNLPQICTAFVKYIFAVYSTDLW